ncbi:MULTISPECIES: PspC domain-containing protein [Streptomycetaceae]|uniref:Integral membrane protein n=1 Tax=Streptantibioticus cattleyicolor (strain ATCC 35852 / DSM 46488 / JCM 4925 / NBRC 14057 / NRRL 8057) TaxID=1003195 RepID=F8JZG1_STREN|nr:MULTISPECIES: PspC domain-containing protein [Streptomycetaceae]AEW96045.1 integral membrane protein [Streptantibioticus cattleyicolor NRRL 8057 = DSM 46488]MYS60576.1 PspC domain-containing protein [Streptomyces sp. SID5468]CCB76380.1 conserved membrane protein of unknown function [Streptantibioticus cattleyicolor NRRL 8057 = DSM 46488]
MTHDDHTPHAGRPGDGPGDLGGHPGGDRATPPPGTGPRRAGGPAEQAAPPAPTLRRSTRQKVLGGVCGGAGRYFGMDPVIFRVVLSILALTGGIGLIVYGIGWLLIPLEGEDETELHRLLTGRIDGAVLTALLLTLAGTGFFLSTLDNGDTQSFSLCLLAVTAAAVYWSRRRRAAAPTGPEGGETAASAASPVAPPAPQPPPTTAGPSWWREPRGTTGYLWGPEDASATPPVNLEKETPPGTTAAQPPVWTPPPRPAPRERRPGTGLGLATFSLAVAVAALVMTLTWPHHPLGTTLEAGLVAALAVFGLGLVAGAFLGRSGGGTITWALITCALLAGAAVLPKSVGTDWHDVVWRPADATQVQPHYQLGTGQAELDLTGVRLGGRTLDAGADVGAGRLRVLVPKDATVEVSAKVGLGDVRLPGDQRVSGGPWVERSALLGPAAGTASSGTVQLTLHVGTGEVEVVRDQSS